MRGRLRESRDMKHLVVDTSYVGQNGIARYSREVLSRLTPNYDTLGLKWPSTDARSVVDMSRMLIGSDSILYSPGYATGVSLCRQFLTLHDLTHFRQQLRLRRTVNGLYYRTVVKPAIMSSGIVFTVSNTAKNEIQEWIKDERVRVVNTGNGCSRHFTYEGEIQLRVRPYILFVGNAKPHKRFDKALDVIQRKQDYDLCVVATDIDVLRMYASRRSLAARCVFLTSLTESTLASYYRGASALLFPSDWEGFGLPAVEADQCGAPVVHWSGAMAVNEALGGNGIVYADQDDEESIFEAVEKAIKRGRQKSSLPRAQWDEVASIVDRTLLQEMS